MSQTIVVPSNYTTTATENTFKEISEHSNATTHYSEELYASSLDGNEFVAPTIANEDGAGKPLPPFP